MTGQHREPGLPPGNALLENRVERWIDEITVGTDYWIVSGNQMCLVTGLR
jgi:hypothetical protein